jgi:hypothetical protein
MRHAIRTRLNKTTRVPKRYLPKFLSKKDRQQQAKMLLKSRKLYKKGIYFTRRKLPSFKSQKSPHILKAERIYGVKKVGPNQDFSAKTGCSVKTLKKIINKGAGAYFSSGSRPNQSAQSWGIARLASAVTGGKASIVDYHLLREGCKPTSKALRLRMHS